MAGVKNTILNFTTYYYPLGNTPAVCLTEDLPVDRDAEILLLGCGDARNVLFTMYSNDGLGKGKKLDITCCDIEPAIIARNLILYTLLLNNQDGFHENEIWNIYYHPRVDRASLEMLHMHLSKLQQYTGSLESWRNGPYSYCLQFCDRRTLGKIDAALKEFAIGSQLRANKQVHNEKLERAHKLAHDTKASVMGKHATMTGFRSAAPIGIEALSELPQLHDQFWKTGTTDVGKIAAKATYLNPLFASLINTSSILHYGTDPYYGFHLATAFGLLDDLSPLLSQQTDKKNRVQIACKVQFKAWCESFRKAARTSLIRFFAGDAVAFCYALQHIGNIPSNTSPGLYSDSWSLQPIELDNHQYSGDEDAAPTKFNVIDTSNLIDHLGPVNILVSVTPLLDTTPSSSLFMEVLVQHSSNTESLIEDLFCGHFATISILFGLNPIEYWTKNTSAATMEETLLDSVMKVTEGGSAGQLRTRIRFKKSVLSIDSSTIQDDRLSLDVGGLTRFLRDVYLKMFSGESIEGLMDSTNLKRVGNIGIGKRARGLYNRSSFCALLRLLKDVINVDFNNVIGNLLEEIANDRTLLIGREYLQELFLYLHQSGLYSVSILKDDFHRLLPRESKIGTSSWRSLPPVMCVTLKVPRKAIQPLIKSLETNGIKGTPCAGVTIESAIGGWSNMFAAVQVTSGIVKTAGERGSPDFRISVEEAVHDWYGNLPLLVSLQVPAHILVQDPNHATISFGLQSNVDSYLIGGKVLGPLLRIFQTALGDKSSVYITRDRPNILEQKRQTKPAVQQHAPDEDAKFRINISAQFNSQRSQVTTFTRRVDILSSKLKGKLPDKTLKIEVVQNSPTSLSLCIGNEKCLLSFPAPVLGSQSKLRIARKSGYIEVISAIVYPLDKDFYAHHMFPMSLEASHRTDGCMVPLNWNMSQVNLAQLPILNVHNPSRLNWLGPHVFMQLSSRERVIRDAKMMPDSKLYGDRRVDFKESLFSMFVMMTGTQGIRTRTFALHKENAGGIHALIFVSALRLSLADHSVVLDAAVLPLQGTHILADPLLWKFLDSLQNAKSPTDRMMTIHVSDDELRLWKKVLPAYVERCRTWQHTKTCEYTLTSQMPLKDGLEDGKTPLCSCGIGKFPNSETFIKGCTIKHMPTILSKYATRAAISPCFAVPWVEDCSIRVMDQSMSQFPRSFNEINPTLAGLMDGIGINGGGMSEISDILSRIQLKCASCGRSEEGTNATSLQRCSRCQIVRYCSTQCQRADWTRHKLLCRKT